MKAAKRGLRGDQRERCREIDPGKRGRQREKEVERKRERGEGDGEA